MTVMERFKEIAMLAADDPPSISTIRCVIWAGVHFRLPMRTMWPNPTDQVSFRSDCDERQLHAAGCLIAKPVPAPEQQITPGLTPEPSTVCVSSHLLFLNKARSDKAIWRC